MAAQAVIEPLQAALLELRVELGEAGHHRDRHQEVAPGVADHKTPDYVVESGAA